MNPRSALAASVVIFVVGGFCAVAEPQVPEQQAFARPVPLGVSFANIGSVTVTKDKSGTVTAIECASGTLAALVQDQSGNQYGLTAGHVMVLGPTGLLSSGAMVQPSTGDTPYPNGDFSGCYQNQANAIANFTLVVGKPGSTNPTADAGIARAIAGDISTSVYSIGPVGSVPFVPRKRLAIQKVGRSTGLTTATLVVERGRRFIMRYCESVPPFGKPCSFARVEYFDQMLVRSQGFADMGDSGSLVMTKGSCPQPIGIVIGGVRIGGNITDVYISPMSDVLTALQSAGNYSSLKMVPSCSTSSGDQAQNTSVDPDVAAAENAIAQEGSVWLSATGVVAVTVDMSVTPAAIDIECANQGYADVLPGQFHYSYNGIPIEYSVEEEADAL